MRLTIVTFVLLVFAGQALAASPGWTRPQAIAAIETARLWRGNPPATPADYISPIKVEAVVSAVPKGKPRKVRAKLYYSKWEFTVDTSTGSVGLTATERFCVHVLSPFKGAGTIFRIGGWAAGSTMGGCAEDNGTNGTTFEWGGSASWKP